MKRNSLTSAPKLAARRSGHQSSPSPKSFLPPLIPTSTLSTDLSSRDSYVLIVLMPDVEVASKQQLVYGVDAGRVHDGGGWLIRNKRQQNNPLPEAMRSIQVVNRSQSHRFPQETWWRRRCVGPHTSRYQPECV